MNVKQIYTIVNAIEQEATGETAIIAEDLSNIVEVGGTILEKMGVDNYVKSLVNKIGKTIFVDRTYTGGAPDIAVDSWEYGSILEKVRCELPDAVANPTWTLTKGQSVDPFIFNPPEVSAKFYNSKTTFSVDISFTDVQVRESMRSASDLNRFFAMIENRIRMKIRLAKDNLTMRTIVNLISEKLAAGDSIVDLLAMYNANHTPTITAAQALTTPAFLRFACSVIMLYRDYITKASVLYNMGGYVTFTPKERQHMILISEFDTALKTELYSTTYHDDLVRFGDYDTVPFWQGSGNTAPVFTTATEINASVASDPDTTIHRNYVVGVLFDRDACAICNNNPRVTSIWNPRGEYTNYFYKEDCSYLNDLDENAVVFTIGTGVIS